MRPIWLRSPRSGKRLEMAIKTTIIKIFSKLASQPLIELSHSFNENWSHRISLGVVIAMRSFWPLIKELLAEEPSRECLRLEGMLRVPLWVLPITSIIPPKKNKQFHPAVIKRMPRTQCSRGPRVICNNRCNQASHKGKLITICDKPSSTPSSSHRANIVSPTAVMMVEAVKKWWWSEGSCALTSRSWTWRTSRNPRQCLSGMERSPRRIGAGTIS